MSSERLIPLGAPRLATCRQLAEWLHVSIGTIHNWSKSGILPAPLKLGQRTFRWETDRVRGALQRVDAVAHALNNAGQPA